MTNKCENAVRHRDDIAYRMFFIYFTQNYTVNFTESKQNREDTHIVYITIWNGIVLKKIKGDESHSPFFHQFGGIGVPEGFGLVDDGR